jgi:hypothetical protein
VVARWSEGLCDQAKCNTRWGIVNNSLWSIVNPLKAGSSVFKKQNSWCKMAKTGPSSVVNQQKKHPLSQRHNSVSVTRPSFVST